MRKAVVLLVAVMMLAPALSRAGSTVKSGKSNSDLVTGTTVKSGKSNSDNRVGGDPSGTTTGGAEGAAASARGGQDRVPAGATTVKSGKSNTSE